jgi:hypothetical protein
MSPLKSWSDRRKEADAEGAKFAPLQPDRYSFVIVDAAKVEEKDGNPRFKINPAVEAGERAKARIFHTFYVSDKPAGMRFFFEQMDALGLDQSFFDRDPSNDQIAAALKGRRFTAEVFNDEWEGKVNQKLKEFAPPVGSAPAGPGGGPVGAFTQASAPVTAAVQGFGQAPVQQQQQQQQQAPVAQQQAPAPVQPQAPQQYAPAPVQQYAPAPIQQQAPAPQQYAPAPVQQYAQAPVEQQAPAADSPWSTPQSELAPPPFL